MSRILMVNYEYPPLGGGAGNATAHIAREMVRQGARVLVVTSAFRNLPAREETHGIAIRRIPTLRRHAEKCSPLEMTAFMASACLNVPFLARAFKPSAQIAFFGIPSGPAAWLARAACNAPYVVSLRGGDVPGFQPYDLARLHAATGPLIRFLWRGAGAVVANSQGLADLARRGAPDVQVSVIPNGVDPERFHPRQGRRPDGPACNGPASDGPVRLVFCGRVVFQKGLDVLLDALAMLPSDPAWELHIVGDGPARPRLEAQAAELGLSDRIVFRGWFERDQLADVIRDMDVFVFPSRHEGMPNAMLEAMASGLAVAASRIAGNEELVEDGVTGYLVPPESPMELALALTKLLASPQARLAMGQAGRLKAVEHYSWTSVAAQYLALCQVLG